MNVKNRPTIRSRLILLVMACLIPLSLMMAGLIAYEYRNNRARLIRDSISTARAMMAAVDRDLAGTQGGLLALAASPYLVSNDFLAFYKQAKDVLKTQNANNIVLIDRSFQQRINTLRPFDGKLPVESNPALLKVFDTGKPVITDVFVGQVAKKHLIAVAVPVFEGEKVVYVLAAGIWPERLYAMLKQQRLPEEWISAIFDSSGTIAARTKEMERFIGHKGSAALIARMAQTHEDSLQSKTLEGIPVLSVFSTSALSNWTVAIGIPIAILDKQLHNTLWLLVISSTGLLFVSILAAWVIGGKIAASIHDLKGPALALGFGEVISVPPLPLKEVDELGQALAKASIMLVTARYQANHDILTGLANRGLFDEILTQQIAICGRTGTSLTVAYIDLDKFKSVNDTHGHMVGDDLLRMVAARIKNEVRESDIVARLGGDEFALILPHTGLEAARTVAQKMIESLSASYSMGSLTLDISASIGLAGFPESGTTRAVILQRADEAMYQAKAAGRCRYMIAV